VVKKSNTVVKFDSTVFWELRQLVCMQNKILTLQQNGPTFESIFNGSFLDGSFEGLQPESESVDDVVGDGVR